VLYIATLLSGSGYLPLVALTIASHLPIEEISVSLVESRAEEDCEEKDKKAIVERIARMTITTISSTKVNALFFCKIIS
jgi:hypothetical protein